MCEGLGTVVDQAGNRVLRFATTTPGFVYIHLTYGVNQSAQEAGVQFRLLRNLIPVPLTLVGGDLFPSGIGNVVLAFPCNAGDYAITTSDLSGTLIPMQYMSYSVALCRTFRIYS